MHTTKFKIGDKVRNIENHFKDTPLWKDKIYTIQAIDLVTYPEASLSFLEFNDDPARKNSNWWKEPYFELVQTTAMKSNIDYLQLAKDVAGHV